MLGNGNAVVELPSGKLFKRSIGGEEIPELPQIAGFREACNAFITRDTGTLLLKERAILLAKRDEPVLILGESGTGKELIAQIVHGERRGNFVGVNVCAVTDTLFESELFGHIKGSFTGAHKDREGLIAEAAGGTLFLDEIGDMTLPLQAKLLRVIQSRRYRKVGSSTDEPMKCRLVAATHQDLAQMVKDKTFRLDLYQRLKVFDLHIKPLRERMQDVELYVGTKFLGSCPQVGSNRNRENVILSGNVRQLLNIKLKCEVFGLGSLTPEDLL